MVKIFAARGNDPAKEVSVGELPDLLDERRTQVWVDIHGQDETAHRIVTEIFKFHPLAVEDCFGAREHPKAEAYDDYVYIITHGLVEGSSAERHDTVELDAFL